MGGVLKNKGMRLGGRGGGEKKKNNNQRPAFRREGGPIRRTS